GVLENLLEFFLEDFIVAVAAAVDPLSLLKPRVGHPLIVISCSHSILLVRYSKTAAHKRAILYPYQSGEWLRRFRAIKVRYIYIGSAMGCAELMRSNYSHMHFLLCFGATNETLRRGRFSAAAQERTTLETSWHQGGWLGNAWWRQRPAGYPTACFKER